MRTTRESRLQLRLASTSFVVLLLAVVGVLMWLSRDYHLQFDWTRKGRNTLSEASRNLLKTLDKPLQVTAFARETEGVRSSISEFVGRYQKYKKDIRLEFVNPDTDPARTRAAGVRLDGELVVEYNGRKENLNQVTEEAFTNALARLGRGGDRWVVFVTGHGERSPDRQANFDLSTWSAQLAKRGLKTRTLALGGSNSIPQNTSVLVIASPRVKYLAGEVKQIEQYLVHGGNLLWLADPGPLQGLQPVAESLGVEFQRGVVVDPTSQALTGASPEFVVATRYGSQPAVRGFDLTTLFPEAQGITVQPPKGWERQTVVDTAAGAWIETGPLTGRIQFNAGQDTRGPINIGVALTRRQDGREQRVAVFGDGDFLSNTFVGNGGNLELGMNLINWLSSDDAYINVPVRTAPDLNLSLSHNAQIFMLVGFLLILPLGLLGSGVTIWWRRRKR
jgi:gliding motility-associatede transport system auxiliary component